jgi:hypothetical protein
MAFTTSVSLNYATHLPALMRALALTDGPVLELGMGLFSTPYLHYACLLAERYLASYDNNEGWARTFSQYGNFSEASHHSIFIVDDWDAVHMEAPWSVALVDHSPSERRVTEIKRLANLARIIVAHDSNGRWENQYHYSTIYPLFRYRTDWTGDGRHAVVLSNFVDLERFWG